MCILLYKSPIQVIYSFNGNKVYQDPDTKLKFWRIVDNLVQQALAWTASFVEPTCDCVKNFDRQ